MPGIQNNHGGNMLMPGIQNNHGGKMHMPCSYVEQSWKKSKYAHAGYRTIMEEKKIFSCQVK